MTDKKINELTTKKPVRGGHFMSLTPEQRQEAINELIEQSKRLDAIYYKLQTKSSDK